MGRIRDRLVSRPFGEFLVLTGFLSFLVFFVYMGYRTATGIYGYSLEEYYFVVGLMVFSFAVFVAGSEILLVDWKRNH
ncbi:MAG: hypothetical protein ABEK00_02530 [Candidatus Nanohaloarchaea archaeon]